MAALGRFAAVVLRARRRRYAVTYSMLSTRCARLAGAAYDSGQYSTMRVILPASTEKNDTARAVIDPSVTVTSDTASLTVLAMTLFTAKRHGPCAGYSEFIRANRAAPRMRSFDWGHSRMNCSHNTACTDAKSFEPVSVQNSRTSTETSSVSTVIVAAFSKLKELCFEIVGDPAARVERLLLAGQCLLPSGGIAAQTSVCSAISSASSTRFRGTGLCSQV